MRNIPLRLGTFMLIVFGLAHPVRTLHGQVKPETARSESDSGMTVVAEVYCSETKLRTVNARIRWSLAPNARAAAGVTNLAAAKQTIETTVFANGFDKGLYASLPVPSTAPATPLAAVTQARQAPMRAYQIQLIAVEQPRGAAADAGEISAVIENLEPGMNYTWRVVVEGASRVMSAPVTITAPVCPADLIAPNELPRRRP